MPTTQLPSRTITATDGIRLAVYERGSADNPTVVLIHGYPDNHAIWDRVADLLVDRFHVVSYDVRGAGNSGHPVTTSGYRIAQLVDDLYAVLDAVAPDGAHLLAHDWGSIHAWDAAADPRFATRITSFTSISGPSLDMIGTWMRGLPRRPRAVFSQLGRSSYTVAFQLPRLPELATRRGIVARVIAASSSRGEPASTAPHVPTLPDMLEGIGLYRANLVRRLLFPKPRPVSLPVQVLAPVHDVNITVACQTQAPTPFTTDLRTHEIEGNHWVVAQHPELVTERFTTFVDELAR